MTLEAGNQARAFVVMDGDGVIESWCPRAEATLGWSAEEAIGRDAAELLSPESESERRRRLIRRIAARGAKPEMPDFEMVVTRSRDGEDVEIELSMERVALGGRVGVVASFVAAATEQERQQSLRQERRRFKRSFEAAPIGMALVAPDGSFIEVNPALCRLLDRPADQLKRTGFQPLTHPDDLDKDLADLERCLSGEIDGYEMEKRYLLPDGSEVWAQLHVSLIRDEDCSPVHFVSQIADISDRKRVEDELQALNGRLRELAKTEPLGGLVRHGELDRELDRRLAGGTEGSLAIALLESTGALTRETLQRIGEKLAPWTTGGNMAARAGDRRFIVMMPQTHESDARAALEGIRLALAAGEPEIRIGFGTAATIGGEDPASLVARAELDLEAGAGGADLEGILPETLPPRLQRRVRKLIALARQHLDMDLALVGELHADRQTFRLLDGDSESFGLDIGDQLEDSYCRRMIEGAIPNVIPDTRTEPGVRDLTLTERAGIGAYVGVPLRLAGGRFTGALCVLSHRPRPDLDDRHRQLLQFIAELITEAFEQHDSEQTARRADLIDSGIGALLSALAARDHYTGEHSDAVVTLAGAVARRLGLDRDKVAEIEQIAVLHDIGKVGIPDSVLQKQGPLNELEWELMREHPVIGERIVRSVDALAPLAGAIRAEHERFDGRGYPDGLRGGEIPIASRVVLACDAYHAMVSDRPYRKAMSKQRALEELREQAGSQFDPDVATQLIGLLEGRSTPHSDDGTWSVSSPGERAERLLFNGSGGARVGSGRS